MFGPAYGLLVAELLASWSVGPIFKCRPTCMLSQVTAFMVFFSHFDKSPRYRLHKSLLEFTLPFETAFVRQLKEEIKWK